MVKPFPKKSTFWKDPFRLVGSGSARGVKTPSQEEPIGNGPDKFSDWEDLLSPVDYQAQAEVISEEAATALNFPPDRPR